jgi:site-specific DNA-methyltransferase (adenine-specific)
MYELYLGDCLEYMKSMPDKSVDAVITDPPYGIADVWKGGSSCGWSVARLATAKRNEWDSKPDAAVFENILRVGNKSIIWGGNYFDLPISRGWLIWVKPERGFSLSEAELAWTTMQMPMRVWEHRRSDPDRIHPTQKPTGLMRWCIQNWTNPTDTIFDPFMGSGTTGVAAIQLGRNFIGCEIDPTYYAIAEKRIKEATLQPQLFPSHVINSTQEKLIE